MAQESIKNLYIKTRPLVERGIIDIHYTRDGGNVVLVFFELVINC